VIYEHGQRTVSQLDSPFALKSAETLNELAAYASTLGASDPRLTALALIGGALGHGTDEWTPGSQQGSALAGAGFGAEGVASDILLAELTCQGVADLIDYNSRARSEIGGQVALAKSEAAQEVAEERDKLARERDEALGDLDAERVARREADRQVEHLKTVLNAVAPTKKRKVKPMQKNGKPATKKAEVDK
jgi:hypothetical protein